MLAVTADRALPPGSLAPSTLCNKLPHGLRDPNNDCVTRFDSGVARERLGLSWVTLLSPWCGPSAYAVSGWLVWSSQDGTSHVWSGCSPGFRQDSWPNYHQQPQESRISGCRGPWVAAASGLL